MSANGDALQKTWSTRLVFILAATGSAVGLGNIWKFPYITGEHGGGAFVLVYLLCILFVGIPIMIAEVLMGRRGRHDSVDTFENLAIESATSKHWRLIGMIGAISAFFILSFYSVVAGWILSYIIKMGTGEFVNIDVAASQQVFGDLLAKPGELLFYQAIFIGVTLYILGRGVTRGIETASKIMMPALFILLLILLGYSMTLDSFAKGAEFLLAFDFSKLSTEAIVVALGHSFFTLSVGMTIMMTYGAYMPGKSSIISTAVTVGVLDTLVALISGLIIFPVVFASGFEPGAGPGLMFQTLPVAFSQMPGGVFFGVLFFILVAFAAWTSAISLLEPSVAWVAEATKWSRWKVVLVLGAVLWLVGLLSVFSFNLWADIKFFDKTFFDLIDFTTANIMLPLGGLLTAIFAGWFLNKSISESELSDTHPLIYKTWLFTVKIISPAAVLFIAFKTLFGS